MEESGLQEQLKRLGLLDNNGKINETGLQVLSGLLSHVKPYPVFIPGRMPSPYNLFIKIMGLVVPAAIEMVLIRDDQVYLTPRKDIFGTGPHFPGSWMGPGEVVENCQRIADRETPGIELIAADIIGCVTSPDCLRFQGVSLITVVSFRGEPTDGEWFKITEPPANLIEVHRPFWPIILNHLKGRE